MDKSRYKYSEFYRNMAEPPQTQSVISVIVIAHNRKTFIRDAIDSISHQTLERDRFEVIVVKNFKDKAIDEAIKSYGYINLFTDKINLGEKLITGLQYCRGDIITFLEDDDVYADDRLKVVSSVFHEDRINYFHNVFIECDIALKPVSKPRFPQIRHTRTICQFKFNSDFLNWAVAHSVQSNLSSIAVRRSVLESIKEIIKSSNGGEDLSIFLQCCRLFGCISGSSIPLTYVRIHTSFFTTYNSNVLKNTIAFRIQRNNTYLRTYNMNFIATNNTKPIVHWLKYVIIYRNILNKILGYSDNSTLDFRKYIFSLFYSLRHKMFIKFTTVFISFFLYILDYINMKKISDKFKKAIINVYF
jgi:glycosyltransferase involved in cell wall biosynthesis